MLLFLGIELFPIRSLNLIGSAMFDHGTILGPKLNVCLVLLEDFDIPVWDHTSVKRIGNPDGDYSCCFLKLVGLHALSLASS